jgi:hypothetical protein
VRALLAALVAVVIFVVAQFLTVIAELFRIEFRTRLRQLPDFLVRLAVRRIPAVQRDDLGREWLAEVHRLVHGTAEELPVSSLATAIFYALGLLVRGPAIAREFSGTKRHAIDMRATLRRLLARRMPGGPVGVGSGPGAGAGSVAVSIPVTAAISISVALAAALAVYGTRPAVPPMQFPPSAAALYKPIDIVILASESGSTTAADIVREARTVENITHAPLSPQSWVTVVGYGGNDGMATSQYPVSVVCRPTQIDNLTSHAYLSECIRGLHMRTATQGWNTDYAAALQQARAYLANGFSPNLRPGITKAILLMANGPLELAGDPAYPQPHWQPAAIQATEIQLDAAQRSGVHVWLCPSSGNVNVAPGTLAQTLMLQLPDNCPASYLKKLLKDS